MALAEGAAARKLSVSGPTASAGMEVCRAAAGRWGRLQPTRGECNNLGNNRTSFTSGALSNFSKNYRMLPREPDRQEASFYEQPQS
jgi:hypothetical protein